ncbi:MAG TPA: Ppx/GppA phosphatase family protein [Actinomycetota bacterium]|nr:Ppx/GppA phosphatase family protein [Actinomycetota bacterium]
MRRAAAIDVGTNSVRLYVAELADGKRIEVERDLVITRMGEGVDASGSLGDDALRRTVEAVADYHRHARDAEADVVRIAATSAVRDSHDRDRFVAAVRDATGVVPEILTGEQEARCSFLGAVDELEGPGPFLVVDVGGGSTEFVRGSRTVEAWISLDVGSVRLTERHIRHDPPSEEELAGVGRDADAAVDQAKKAVGDGPANLVGLAGTATTLAAVSLGLRDYDRDRIHHAALGIDEIGRITAELGRMTNDQRRRLPVMPPGREDVIVAGAVILLRVMEGFGSSEMIVSESDLLDGLVLTLSGDA